MSLLNEIKPKLRITTTAMDEAIQDLIDAAKMDMKTTGINIDKTVVEDETEKPDPLIKRAITLYCKAHFGYDNPDATRFEQCYDALKTHLALSFDYRAEVADV